MRWWFFFSFLLWQVDLDAMHMLSSRQGTRTSLLSSLSLLEPLDAVTLSGAMPSTISIADVSHMVSVQRNTSGSFGFSVGGGCEDDMLPCIVLKKSSTPLCLHGAVLLHHDEIVAIDGVVVCGYTHARVIEIIMAAGATMELAILNRPTTARRKLSEYCVGLERSVHALFIMATVRRMLNTTCAITTSRPRDEAGKSRVVLRWRRVFSYYHMITVSSRYAGLFLFDVSINRLSSLSFSLIHPLHS